MLSTIKDNKYIVLEDDRAFAQELDKEQTDNALNELRSAFSMLADLYENLEKTSMYEFLQNHVNVCEKSYYSNPQQMFSSFAGKIKRLQNTLETNNDKIPAPEDRLTLEDIGFNEVSPGFYEHVIEDTEEKEVVQEIQLRDEILFRLRTTLWEPTDYGKTSKEITYESVPLTKDMAKIINNSTLKIWGL